MHITPFQDLTLEMKDDQRYPIIGTHQRTKWRMTKSAQRRAPLILQQIIVGEWRSQAVLSPAEEVLAEGRQREVTSPDDQLSVAPRLWMEEDLADGLEELQPDQQMVELERLHPKQQLVELERLRPKLA